MSQEVPASLRVEVQEEALLLRVPVSSRPLSGRSYLMLASPVIFLLLGGGTAVIIAGIVGMDWLIYLGMGALGLALVFAMVLFVFEQWPHPIFQLYFADLRLVDPEGDEMVCD